MSEPSMRAVTKLPIKFYNEQQRLSEAFEADRSQSVHGLPGLYGAPREVACRDCKHLDTVNDSTRSFQTGMPD